MQINGKGVPKEIISRIFQPYFTTKGDSGSNGLGLSLIHKLIAKEVGGTIECFSIQEEKTTFSIQIPGVNPEYTKGELS